MGEGGFEMGCFGYDRQKFDDSIFDEVPQDAGPRLATFRGGVTHVIRPPGSQKVARSEHNLVSIMLEPSANLQSAISSDSAQTFDAVPGALVITPAGADATVSWSSTRENITVVLPTEGVDELIEHEFQQVNRKFSPVPLGTVDAWALSIARQMKAEFIQPHAPNELYLDSLITVLGVHLLRNYAGVRKPWTTASGGLSQQQARLVAEYLENNFAGKVSVAELARVAGLSHHYFIQAFARSFGKPPHRYLIDRRLDFAEELILGGDLPIANVAYLSGFSSQSHLTATMRKHRGRTPMQVRRGR
ncbi:AraC family transcriptional regulator [uncultured Nitratireductor sp.]|mgnify:CR=1 FL=1|uniref:helix-turn-helix domain-containing protein n=1 Tax=uncultured Nitratireductor sp. TaxID=520953 RepID=UPI0025E4DFDF|nr:AraC family transcriptional regulator [uncultured Nitratireductor sp.]